MTTRIPDGHLDMTRPVHRGAPCGLCQESATHRGEVVPFTLYIGGIAAMLLAPDWALCTECATRMERNDWKGVLRRTDSAQAAEAIVQGFRRNLISVRPLP